MLNVGVVGLGYVGLTFSIVAARKGINVYGVEKNDDILDSIKNKKAHFFEKGINSALAGVIDRKLTVSKTFKEQNRMDYFIITVGTPLTDCNKTPKIDYIIKAIDSFSKLYTGKELVILRSTVSVGVTRKYVVSYLSKISGISPSQILVAFCPERTIEGDALKELITIPQIIGANNEKSYFLAEKLFRLITPTILSVESIEAAELIKLFNNTFRDIHFSVGNYFNEIAQSFGINGVKLIQAANYQYSRSQIARPGLVGGPCLEKDSYILVHNMKDSKGKEFVLGARRYNESLEDNIVGWVKEKVDRFKIESIGITGIAFKGKPDTSDLRGSNALSIIKKLNRLGVDTLLHDFVADQTELSEYGVVFNDLYKMANGLQLIVILNNNVRYENLHLDLFEYKMQAPKIVFDCWSCINISKLETTLKIFTLGDMELNYD